MYYMKAYGMILKVHSFLIPPLDGVSGKIEALPTFCPGRRHPVGIDQVVGSEFVRMSGWFGEGKYFLPLPGI
jgi:hypothetical protein